MRKEFKTAAELERLIAHQLDYLGFAGVTGIAIAGRSDNWTVSSFRAIPEDQALVSYLIQPIVKRMQSEFSIFETMVPRRSSGEIANGEVAVRAGA